MIKVSSRSVRFPRLVTVLLARAFDLTRELSRVSSGLINPETEEIKNTIFIFHYRRTSEARTKVS